MVTAWSTEKPGSTLEEAPEAARHEGRPDQQRQGQAELRHDHGVAQPGARRQSGRVRLQRVLRRHPRRSKRRADAGQDAGHDRRQHCHRDHPPVDGDLGDARNRQRAQRIDARRCDDDPRAPPAAVTTRLSTSSCAIARARDSPSACRTASSKARAEARTSSRFEGWRRRQQQQRDRAEQHHQGAAQRSPTMSSASGTRRVRQPRSPAGIDGAIGAATACNSRIGRLDRHAGREPREDTSSSWFRPVFLGDVGLHRHRDLDVAGQRQAARRHADDEVGVPTSSCSGLADDVGRPPKRAPPGTRPTAPPPSGRSAGRRRE